MNVYCDIEAPDEMILNGKRYVPDVVREVKLGDVYLMLTERGMNLRLSTAKPDDLKGTKLIRVVYKEEPRWRAKYGEIYYYLASTLFIRKANDEHYSIEDHRYLCGNYFKTDKEALSAQKKIIELLKQE